ncbi:MAG: S9 family peptidase, partial [Planctomycetia bacterium]|nr:S9 family peptidase [Planctomycetia bacterium]
MRIVRVAAVAALLVYAPQLLGADKRPMTLDDFFAIKRVASPQISPDGKHVVYQVTSVDLKENKSNTALWVATTDGKGTPKQITPKGANPRWSPDGKHILFESRNQLYVTDLAGRDPMSMTSISTGASNGIWSLDGKFIAFVSSVYPEFSEKPFKERDKLNKEKDEEIAKNPVTGAGSAIAIWSRAWTSSRSCL